MDEVHKQILRTNRRFIIDNIDDVPAIIDPLMEKEILTEGMKQEIEAMNTPIARVRKLLDIIPKRGPYAFDIFCNVLILNKIRHVAEKLNPALAHSHVTPLPPTTGPTSSPPTSNNNTSSNKPKSPYPQPISLPKVGVQPINENQSKNGNQPTGSSENPVPSSGTGPSAGSNVQPQPEVRPPAPEQHPPPENVTHAAPTEEPFEPPSDWPKSLKMTPFSFKVKKCDQAHVNRILQERIYRMSSKPRGRALLIKNISYPEEGNYADRSLTQGDNDSARVQFVLADLGFKLRMVTNVSREELFLELKKEVASDHDDAFIVIVFSYGGEGSVLCTDGTEVPVTEMVNVVNSHNCPALAGKPKLFFIQACGTKMKESDVAEHNGSGDAQDAPAVDPASLDLVVRGMESLALEPPAGIDLTDTAPGGSMNDPLLKDMLVAMATVPDNDMKASQPYSSLFILGLLDVICQRSYTDNLLEILTKVNRLRRDPARDEVVPLCRFKHSLSKKLYFLPGYHHTDTSRETVGQTLPDPGLGNMGQGKK